MPLHLWVNSARVTSKVILLFFQMQVYEKLPFFFFFLKILADSPGESLNKFPWGRANALCWSVCLAIVCMLTLLPNYIHAGAVNNTWPQQSKVQKGMQFCVQELRCCFSVPSVPFLTDEYENIHMSCESKLGKASSFCGLVLQGFFGFCFVFVLVLCSLWCSEGLPGRGFTAVQEELTTTSWWALVNWMFTCRLKLGMLSLASILPVVQERDWLATSSKTIAFQFSSFWMSSSRVGRELGMLYFPQLWCQDFFHPWFRRVKRLLLPDLQFY